MKKFTAALMLFIAICFFGIRPAAAAAWYEATVTRVGPVSDSYYVVYLSSSSWGSVARNFTIYPTLNNTITAVALAAITSSRTVLVQLNSTTVNDYCFSMILK